MIVEVNGDKILMYGSDTPFVDSTFVLWEVQPKREKTQKADHP
ncbi:hypothetical protein [Chroococcidiopsis sp. CCMEE 29]|nr:hypothetical protein [Chroococcidiopsis sp. CCMEE 29]